MRSTTISNSEAFHDGKVTLYPGECLDIVRTFADNSIDAVVTDPPYALVSIAKRFGGDNAAVCKAGKTGAYQRASAGFMGKKWDTGETAFAVEFWAQILRVLKPGGHVVAFGSTRSYHRLACAIEDAGFEIRDQLAWCYGTGFPKSHDVSKGIDKAAGATREIVSIGAPVKRMIPGADQAHDGWEKTNGREFIPTVTRAGTAAAAQWEGWGTALKPAWEPICLARKPLSERNVAANVLRWGTGAINIDATRTGTDTRSRSTGEKISDNLSMAGANYAREIVGDVIGRWPANIAHDGSDEVISAFPSAPAARFFYSAKADPDSRLGSKHPTVKPVDLMQWLCRLTTPPGGLVLDPFAGTGSTGEAAFREGFRAALIEREAEYQIDIRRRLAHALSHRRQREEARVVARGQSDYAGPLFGDAVSSPSGGRGGGGAGRYTGYLPTRADGDGPDDRTGRASTMIELSR